MKKLFGFFALLFLAGCVSTPSVGTVDSLLAAGFKVVTPKTQTEQAKLDALPYGQLIQIQRNGNVFYVYADPSNNRAFVGGPDQYRALYSEAVKLAVVTNADYDRLDWDRWNGWGVGWDTWYGRGYYGSTYGHARRMERRFERGERRFERRY